MDYFKGSKQVKTATVTDPFNTIKQEKPKSAVHSPRSPFASDFSKDYKAPQPSVRNTNTFSSNSSNFY